MKKFLCSLFLLLSFNLVHAQGTRIVDLPAQGSAPDAFMVPGAASSGAAVTTITVANIKSAVGAGLATVATTGSYTDLSNKPSIAAAPTINDSPGRSLVTTTASTGYQISSTRPAQACYEGSFSTTSTIGGPAAATVFLETADTNSTTPSDWTTKATQTYSNTITLAVVLNQVQANNWAFCRMIPAGKFVRVRSGSISGTASVSINANQQETLF